MFSLDFSQKAKKFLKSLDKHIYERIVSRIENLQENPVPSDSKFIGRDKGEKVFRYRVGDYRVLYKLKEKDKIVLITKIEKRSKVY